MPLIAHTTDLTGDDELAFLHATALAAASSARLITVHGNAPPETAARLPDASRFAWASKVVHERRCHECCDDVTDTVLDAMRELAPDLVVIGTHARHGLAAFLHDSVGEALARNLRSPTLVVPNRARGFVDPVTGAIDLRRLLVPARDAALADHGRAAARALLALAGIDHAEIEILHVERGNLEAAVLAAAAEHHACAIVMPTHGHDGVGDILRGSHTERVIREAPCPVLSVPIA